MITWSVIINAFGICYMFVCVVPSSHARARRKSASDFSFILYFSNASDSLKVRARRKSAIDFSFILYFSNASDSLKVQDTSPEYLAKRSRTVNIILKLLSRS